MSLPMDTSSVNVADTADVTAMDASEVNVGAQTATIAAKDASQVSVTATVDVEAKSGD